MLHELVPNASVLAVLVNPNNPNAEADLGDMQAAVSNIEQTPAGVGV